MKHFLESIPSTATTVMCQVPTSTTARCQPPSLPGAKCHHCQVQTSTTARSKRSPGWWPCGPYSLAGCSQAPQTFPETSPKHFQSHCCSKMGAFPAAAENTGHSSWPAWLHWDLRVFGRLRRGSVLRALCRACRASCRMYLRAFYCVNRVFQRYT